MPLRGLDAPFGAPGCLGTRTRYPSLLPCHCSPVPRTDLPIAEQASTLSTASGPLVGRRSFLLMAVGTGAALVTGCGSTDSERVPGSPDDGVRSAVAEAEASLIAQYQSAITAYPELGASLVAILEQHRAHLHAVLPGEGPAAVSDPGNAGGGPAPAGSVRQALQSLAQAERAASQQRREACGMAADPELARILAFIAASEASHVPALAQVPT